MLDHHQQHFPSKLEWLHGAGDVNVVVVSILIFFFRKKLSLCCLIPMSTANCSNCSQHTRKERFLNINITYRNDSIKKIITDSRL